MRKVQGTALIALFTIWFMSLFYYNMCMQYSESNLWYSKFAFNFVTFLNFGGVLKFSLFQLLLNVFDFSWFVRYTITSVFILVFTIFLVINTKRNNNKISKFALLMSSIFLVIFGFFFSPISMLLLIVVIWILVTHLR